MKVLALLIVLAAPFLATAHTSSDEIVELEPVQISDPPPTVWDSVAVEGLLPSGLRYRISLVDDAGGGLTTFEIVIGDDIVEIRRSCWPPAGVFLNGLSTTGGTSDGTDKMWIRLLADYGPTIQDVGKYTVHISDGKFDRATVYFEAGKLKGQHIDACDFELDAA